MNRDKALERAIELRDHSKEFESVSFLESDAEFFDYVVSLLERTAPEVPVQEQPKFIPEDSNGKYSLTEKSKKCVF